MANDLKAEFLDFYYAHGPLMRATILEQMLQHLRSADLQQIMIDVQKDCGTGQVCYPSDIGSKTNDK